MAQTHITLAFATLLAGAPLLGASAGAAEPAGLPGRAAPTAPADSLHGSRANDANVAARLPNVESNAPTTPTPMNLPDEATANEVKGQRGIGMAGVIIGTVLIAAIIVGALYWISRRSWSAPH